MQICKKFHLHLLWKQFAASNLQLLLSLGIRGGFFTNYIDYTLCLGPKFCEDQEENKARMDQDLTRCLNALWCCSEEAAESHGGGQEPLENERDKDTWEEKTQDMGAPPEPTPPTIILHWYLLAETSSRAQTRTHTVRYKTCFHIKLGCSHQISPCHSVQAGHPWTPSAKTSILRERGGKRHNQSLGP